MGIELPPDKLEEWQKMHRQRVGYSARDLFMLFVDKIKENFVVALLVFGAIIFLAERNGVFGWGSLPVQDLKAASGSSSSDPCHYKERCIIAYVTPWCSSCQASAGFLGQLKRKTDRTSKVGMKIVIGMDSESNLQQMAKNFPGGVFFDLDRTYARKLGVRAVPTVLIANGENEILEKGLPGSIGGLPSEEENLNYYIDSILGLREFY